MAESLSELVIEEDEIRNSHDVEPLFTNTLIDKALEVIKERLEKDQKWKVTNLEIANVIELLEFTLTTTYLQFKGQIYRQKFGAAMGSPVTPLVADIHKEYLEQTVTPLVADN